MGANPTKHLPAIAHIDPQMPQPGEGTLERSKEQGRSLSIRDVGGMDFGPAVVLITMFWGCIAGYIWEIVAGVWSYSRPTVRPMEMRRGKKYVVPPSGLKPILA